jgi:hypothetical protein
VDLNRRPQSISTDGGSQNSNIRRARQPQPQHCRHPWTPAECFGAISINPLVLSSFVRMTVGSRGMFVSELAMLESSSCVLLRLFVLAKIVVIARLMVSGRLVMILTRRMIR